LEALLKEEISGKNLGVVEGIGAECRRRQRILIT
jgi:hypothetical protein